MVLKSQKPTHAESCYGNEREQFSLVHDRRSIVDTLVILKTIFVCLLVRAVVFLFTHCRASAQLLCSRSLTPPPAVFISLACSLQSHENKGNLSMTRHFVY